MYAGNIKKNAAALAASAAAKLKIYGFNLSHIAYIASGAIGVEGSVQQGVSGRLPPLGAGALGLSMALYVSSSAIAIFGAYGKLRNGAIAATAIAGAGGAFFYGLGGGLIGNWLLPVAAVLHIATEAVCLRHEGPETPRPSIPTTGISHARQNMEWWFKDLKNRPMKQSILIDLPATAISCIGLLGSRSIPHGQALSAVILSLMGSALYYNSEGISGAPKSVCEPH